MLWLTERQLKSKNTAARRRAVKRLGHSPHPRALGVLRAALADEDAEVRRLAVTALGGLDDERRIEPLLGVLKDPDAGVLKAAMLALKGVSDERVAEALALVLRHADAGVRGQAAHALELLGWHPPAREDETWFWVAKGQFSRVATLGPAAIPALETALASGFSSPSLGAVEALGYMGDPRALRPLLHALKSGDPAVCVAVIDSLCRLNDPQTVDPLVGLLQHTNPQVRVAAVDALRRVRAASAAGPLCPLLKDQVWEVRREAAETLGRFRDPCALDPLTQALSDEDADVREAAAMALGSLGDRRAIGPLVLALKDEISGVRRIAAAALARIDHDWSASAEARIAAEQLKSALRHEDLGVRYFVSQLLVNMGVLEPQAAAPMGESDTSSVSSPSKRHKLAVSLFVAILCDPDRDLRQAAAEALGRLRDERAHAALLRTQTDADTGVRAAASQALQSFGASGAQT